MIVCTGDHEYSIFDSVEDHAGFSPGSDCELHHAELVVSLGGHRGHYLGRDFVYEAMGLLGVPEAESSPISRDIEILDQYEDDYDVDIEPSFTIAEAVQDLVETYESRLFDAGFYVEWNDGVQVVKIGDEING